MPTYTTVNGETVLYEDPTHEQAAFFDRLQTLVRDPKATEGDITALVYGRENPLLDHAQWPGHSMITAETMKAPLFRVLVDQIDRKREATGALNLDEIRTQFTLTIQEAAARLSVNENTIRHAIETRKLPSWKIDGRVMLAPESVDAYQVSRRDMPTRLQVRIGNYPNATMRFKHAHGFEVEKSPEPHIIEGIVTKWKRCAILESNDGFVTFTAIEPAPEEKTVELGSFYVRGRFRITQQISQAQAAVEAFKAFKPS